MTFLNPTQRAEMLRCPRRFYYRYLHYPDSDAGWSTLLARRRLYGIRELGGHLIHRSLAKMVCDMAGEATGWNISRASEQCVAAFDGVIEKSLNTEPGKFTGKIQLAETFNGLTEAEIRADVSFWRRFIPQALANGQMAAGELRIPRNNGTVSVRAEKVVRCKTATGRRRYVFDVFIDSKHRSTVIDWKCHSITDQDLGQVRSYLRYLHQERGKDVLGLFGHAVNLLTGVSEKVEYNPYPPVDRPKRPEEPTTYRCWTPQPKTVSFEPNPNPSLCARCPYAQLCKASVLRAPHPCDLRLNAGHRHQERLVASWKRKFGGRTAWTVLL